MQLQVIVVMLASILTGLGTSRPTEWLSGSGGTGKTPQLFLHILANRACARAA